MGVMGEETWQAARLIPTSGINGAEEAERRATSALLAVASVVREFGVALVKPLGAPSSALETFIEVPFEVNERRVYPDGIVRARRGAKSWTALVEVKTGTSQLERAQIEDYLDVAREQGFDAVLTVSNEIPHAPGVHPTLVDKRRLKKVALHHYSWSEILTLAVQHRVYRGVSDPEQAWILGELIRYLEHPKSGALDFSDMGEMWTAVRDGVALGTVRPNDKGLTDVVLRWEQLLQFAALRMGRELGADVEVVLSRKEQADPSLRVAAQVVEVVERGRLTGAIRVPQAIGELSIVADLRASRVHVSVDVDAPSEGRQITKVNWLVRQLKDAPAQLRIDSWSHMSRHSRSELLSTARETPDRLVEDPKKNVRTFRVTATSTLGTKRGAGRGGFIDSVLSALAGFYEAVVQDLRPWVAKAPQLPPSGRTAAETAGIDISPPPLDMKESDGDEPERGESADLAPLLPTGIDEAIRDAAAHAETFLDSVADDSDADGPLLSWESVAEREAEQRDTHSEEALITENENATGGLGTV
ncbi:MAG: hypothetical protein AB7L17_07200 [Ilumatobacteraceae bacterium]